MQAGNAHYRTIDDLPATLPVFPLTGALLLPRTQLPLNIFEPRYIAMVDAALASHRLIGMIQPAISEADGARKPALARVGCAGRITSFQESGDGRYLITLQGVTRFGVASELDSITPFRQVATDFAPFANDLTQGTGESDVDRPGLLKAFRAYLDAHGMEADWDSVDNAETEVLVNALCMMSPYGAAEKQAMLEAVDLKTRAETLVAITEIDLARNAGNDGGSTLQ
ncbi:LON peptidase substrate-binding domain-containing protein [Pannonibacter sp. SL95]|uniref:LON peptidase substrate-binding domain-containing protein n=1 Tax=Pannonibacter sp. SL95 TaxID=2995153 RepID=UPI002273E5CA|nr:LON peptidase substrate-binding domain-containing protein [Pannonibacter sp. SL95]MCY1706551.1 LON peptidase substrate-binding domain-containing protein [Pannonibacter sp. SL95]